MKRKSGVGDGFSLPRPSVPDEQSAHCATIYLLPGVFGLMTTVARWMAENAHRSCDTTGWEAGLLMSNPNFFVGTYSAGASSKEVRQAIEDADRLLRRHPFCRCTYGRISTIRRRKHAGDSAPTRRASAKLGSTSRWRRRWPTLREPCLECALRRRRRVPPDSQCGLIRRIRPGESFWQTFTAVSQTRRYYSPLSTVGPQLLALPRCRFRRRGRLWYSRCGDLIGYSCPPRLARKPPAPDRRVILIIGDGAAQLTIQRWARCYATGRRWFHPAARTMTAIL